MIHQQGRLEVICGSMFSGKSEELIRRLRRAIIAKQKVQVFKPSIDDRYGVDRVTSHDGRVIEAIALETPEDLFEKLDDDTTVVGIDEVQFFPIDVISVIHQLIDRDIRVIVAGLDMDFRGEPFGAVPTLMAQADDVEKLHAICVITGEPATHTQRLVDGKPARYDDPIILVGADESYEPRSRQCHDVPGRPW